MPSSRVIGVGAFVLGGALLFAAGLFLIGDRRGLFKDNFEVTAEFSRLVGLENGAAVRVAGMDAGQVTSIRVPTGPRAKFRVRVRIREDLHGVVRTDSVASIQNEGLVGNKFVQIEGGSEAAPRAPDGSTILSRDPFDIADLLQQMSDTMRMVNDTVVVLKADVQTALQTVNDTADEVHAMVVGARDDVDAITADGRRIARDMRLIMDDVNAGRGSIGRLFKDDALYNDARRIASEAERVVINLRDVAEQAKQVVSDFNGRLEGKEGVAGGLAGDLRQTVVHARDAMADLADNAEALKRNFFFRGYYNRRGYFDLDDLSLETYLTEGLAGQEARPLRIWLGADRLFAVDANGVEQLTDEGRARLDSAMSAFLKHPANSPLVVEGYAPGFTTDLRFLASQRRAALVRDYLLFRFTLDSNRVGAIALGNQLPRQAEPPPRQVSGWDGVAIVLYAAR